MKKVFLPILFLISTLAMHGQTFKKYQWKNRILLLVQQSANDGDLARQQDELAKAEKGVAERDLIIFRLAEDGVYQNGDLTPIQATKIRSAYGIQGEFQGLILIGKDGGIKLREPFVVQPQRIFDLIDGMPMRKAEMRAKKKY